MVATLDEERMDGIRGLLAPEAEVRFLALDETELSEQKSAFRGPDGYLAGWLEWLQPYDSFTVGPRAVSDLGEGQVLLEIDGVATLRGSGIEVSVEAAAVYTFDGERIVCADHYLDRAQARRAAGLS